MTGEAKPLDLKAAAAFVEQTVRSSALAITPEALQLAAAELAGSVERDASGAFAYQPEAGAAAFRIEAGAVVEVPVERHVVGTILKHAKPVPAPSPAASQKPSTPTTPSSAPDWAKHSNSPIAGITRAIAEREDARLAVEAEGWPNPWAPAHWNRNRQTIMNNKAPDLAATRRAEAGR